MPRLLLVNLPVADLGASIGFFTSLGFKFDEDLTDQDAAYLVINDAASVVLMRRDFFTTFHHRVTSESDDPVEAVVAVMVESRREVEFICRSAFDAGGTPSLEPSDQGFLYTWSFTDLDGHVWELMSPAEG